MFKKIPAQILVALLFGILAMLVLLVKFQIQITPDFVTDAREIFLTLGAAFSGPIGVLILTVFNGIGNYFANVRGSLPFYRALPDPLAHLISLLLLTILYKKVVYARMKMPLRLLGWVVLVMIYYYIIMTPIGSLIFFVFGVIPSPVTFYIEVVPIIWPEVIITTVITTLVMLALPQKYHKPLWGQPKEPADAPSKGK